MPGYTSAELCGVDAATLDRNVKNTVGLHVHYHSGKKRQQRDVEITVLKMRNVKPYWQ